MADQLSLTSDERTWAMASHAVTFVEGGILGPLVIYMLKRDHSPFIAFHSLQSLLFGVLCLGVVVPATIITCGLGIVLIVPYLIFEVVAVMKANDGEWYQLPLVGAWAFQRHHP